MAQAFVRTGHTARLHSTSKQNLDIAAGAEVELPVAEVVRSRYETAAGDNPTADISAVAALYRARPDRTS